MRCVVLLSVYVDCFSFLMVTLTWSMFYIGLSLASLLCRSLLLYCRHCFVNRCVISRKIYWMHIRCMILFVGFVLFSNSQSCITVAGSSASKMMSKFVVIILKKYADNVAEGSLVNTDEWLGYRKLHKMYKHNVINHKGKEYVRGETHTNTIEGFWAILKRGIKGVYHVMSAKHIQMYIDEYVFRYNTRNMTEYDRFNARKHRYKTQIL